MGLTLFFLYYLYYTQITTTLFILYLIITVFFPQPPLPKDRAQPTNMIPHQVGEIIYQMVRIPNNRMTQNSKPIIHDLALGSSLAASITVPQFPPPKTNVTTILPENYPYNRSKPLNRLSPQHQKNKLMPNTYINQTSAPNAY